MIREIVKDDFDGLMHLYEQLHNNPFPDKSDETMKIWTSILEDRNHHIIVDIENDIIVSSCVCVIIPNLTHNQRPYAFIENVITDENYRKQGLASGCLNYAKQIAISCNCYKMMLLTGSRLESTHHFYQQCGYNKKDKTAFIQWIE